MSNELKTFSQKRFLVTMGIVTVLAVFYFLPKELYAPLTGAFIAQHRIAFPLAVLTICGAFMIPW